VITYTRPDRNSAPPIRRILVDYNHPNRPALGTPPRVIMRPGDVVVLTAQGARLVQNG
jgi:hypothetical protein